MAVPYVVSYNVSTAWAGGDEGRAHRFAMIRNFGTAGLPAVHVRSKYTVDALGGKEDVGVIHDLYVRLTLIGVRGSTCAYAFLGPEDGPAVIHALGTGLSGVS